MQLFFENLAIVRVDVENPPNGEDRKEREHRCGKNGASGRNHDASVPKRTRASARQAAREPVRETWVADSVPAASVTGSTPQQPLQRLARLRIWKQHPRHD